MNNFFSMQRDCFCCALSFKIHSKGINKHILLMNETDTEHWNRNIENKTGGGGMKRKLAGRKKFKLQPQTVLFWILRRATDKQRQQVTRRHRSRKTDKLSRVCMCRKSGQRELESSLMSMGSLWGVISTDSSTNGLSVARQTGTHWKDSRV